MCFAYFVCMLLSSLWCLSDIFVILSFESGTVGKNSWTLTAQYTWRTFVRDFWTSVQQTRWKFDIFLRHKNEQKWTLLIKVKGAWNQAASAKERFADAQLRGNIYQYKIKVKETFTERLKWVGAICVSVACRVTGFAFPTNRFPVFYPVVYKQLPLPPSVTSSSITALIISRLKWCLYFPSVAGVSHLEPVMLVLACPCP